MLWGFAGNRWNIYGAMRNLEVHRFRFNSMDGDRERDERLQTGRGAYEELKITYGDRGGGRLVVRGKEKTYKKWIAPG